MNEVKGDKLFVSWSTAETKRRLKGFGHGVKKIHSAGKKRAVIIHTAVGKNLEELKSIFCDVGCSEKEDDLDRR